MPMFMWFGPGQIRFWDFFGFCQARLKPDPVRGMIKFSLVRTSVTHHSIILLPDSRKHFLLYWTINGYHTN